MTGGDNSYKRYKLHILFSLRSLHLLVGLDSKSEVLDLVLKHKQNILGFTKFLTCNGIQKREKNLQITPKSFLKEQ